MDFIQAEREGESESDGTIDNRIVKFIIMFPENTPVHISFRDGYYRRDVPFVIFIYITLARYKHSTTWREKV